jgi:hypothetical protein
VLHLSGVHCPFLPGSLKTKLLINLPNLFLDKNFLSGAAKGLFVDASADTCRLFCAIEL